MGLSPDQVTTTMRFLQAYAHTSLRDLQAEIRTAAPGIITADPAFTVAADAATAFREAGQWALYLDPVRSRQLLFQAGMLYLRIGQPFGAYLLEAVGSRQQPASYADMLREMTAVQGARDDARIRLPALRHPQQQAYLMLAACAEERPDRTIGSIMERSSYANGVVPVGALGTPIRTLWDIARHLFARRTDSAGVIAGHLAAMARRYADAMTLAQVNQYLWAHGAAPVDVGDIDIAGVAALSARRFGVDPILSGLREAGMSAQRDPIGMAPIEAGLALADPGFDDRHGSF
jgi:hypothetical protein